MPGVAPLQAKSLWRRGGHHRSIDAMRCRCVHVDEERFALAAICEAASDPPFTPIVDRLERVRRTIRMHRRSCSRDATGVDPLARSCDSFADALANCALYFLRRLVVGPGPGATLLRLALKRCVRPTCRWCDLQHVADFRRAIDSTLSTTTGSPLGAPTPCAVRAPAAAHNRSVASS